MFTSGCQIGTTGVGASRLSVLATVVSHAAIGCYRGRHTMGKHYLHTGFYFCSTAVCSNDIY